MIEGKILPSIAGDAIVYRKYKFFVNYWKDGKKLEVTKFGFSTQEEIRKKFGKEETMTEIDFRPFSEDCEADGNRFVFPILIPKNAARSADAFCILAVLDLVRYAVYQITFF